MTNYIAILRGINVSGKKPIKMADLRQKLTEFTDFKSIKTYIQSGNIIFQSQQVTPNLLENSIKNLIKTHWSYEVSCQVYTEQTWANMLSNHPFTAHNNYDESFSHTTFLQRPATENLKTKLQAYIGEGEKIMVKDRYII